ncbi:MAG: serine/threonine-protein kinase [Actinoplanes sp.]
MGNPSIPGLPGDRYVIDSLIGRGGMGRVWKVRDLVLDRHVAIKETTTPHELSDAERQKLRDRTLREARAIARIDHPNVVRVHDVLSGADGPLIVMEYVAGQDLRERMDEGPVPTGLAMSVAAGVLRALAAAHAQGVLHRDVKPGNILLGEHGRVVLTDFGIAKVVEFQDATHTGHIIGTPDYLAPERARDAEPAPAADLWSLGVTLYEAVTGVSPFRREGPLPTLYAIVHDEVTAPPSPLAPLINGLLIKDPARRLDTTAALAILDLPERPARRRRWLIAAALVPVLLAAGGLVWWQQTADQRDPDLKALQSFAGRQDVGDCAAIGPLATQITRRQCVRGDGIETFWIRYATPADRDRQREADLRLQTGSPLTCRIEKGASPAGVRGHYIEYTYTAADDGRQYVSAWWDDEISHPDNAVALNLRRRYEAGEADPAAPLRDLWLSWHYSFT